MGLSAIQPLCIRLPCVAPDAQRPQVGKLVGTTLGLRHDVVYLGFTLVGADASAVLALPCVTDQGCLPEPTPGH
jgi:hypothetical protein